MPNSLRLFERRRAGWTPGAPVAGRLRRLTLLAITAAWLGLACAGSQTASKPPPIVDLSGEWRFHPGELPVGGEEVSRADFDASSWSRTKVPGPFKRSRAEVAEQSGWLRRVVLLDTPRVPISDPLGLALGRINSAYEVWAGGLLLGGVGELPASAGGSGTGRVDYDRQVVWPVPEEAIDGGRLVFAIHVWTDPALGALGGPHEGDFLLGALERLAWRQLAQEVPATVLVALFVLLGLFHLALFFRRRDQVGYFWFSAVSILVAAYSFLRTQWKFHLLPGLSFGWLKETEHVVLFLLLPSFVQLIWILLDLDFKLATRLGQVVSLAFALGVVVLPGYGLNQLMIRAWELLVLAHIVHGVVLIVRERRQQAARTISIGIVLGSCAFIHDILVDFAVLDTPRITILGFAVFVLSLSATLGVQFAQRLKEAEESRRREAELRANEEIARRSSQAKTEFLANMSHEIRTPMTAILGGVELMIGRRPDPETMGRLRVIQQSASSLLGLIDEILDFTQVESGRLEVRPREFDLHEGLTSAMALFSTEAERKGVALRRDDLDEVPRLVLADGDRWRQVLLNLLSNALKFTTEGHVAIHVDARRQGDESGVLVTTTVEDTGVGIDPRVLPSLFEPFTQADASTSRMHGGSGLGLAICRRLVHLLDGEISIESQPGRGTSVRFTVPMIELAVAPTAPQPLAGGDAAASQATWHGARLLLVEDNEVNRLIVAEQLRVAGFEVLTAGDGVQALAVLARETVDLVLMDCQMPHLDGYEATRRWRRGEPDGQHLPIVALTAHALEGERDRCLAAGMDDYVTKPFRSDELELVIGRWIRSPRDRDL